MTRNTHVAVLGGGIMGCCTALCLAERDIPSVLFEQDQDLLTGASRWNEGKIHLGYLYAAAPNLDTARKVLPGGLRFRAIMERLLERSLEPWTSEADECYLFHRDSVVPFAEARSYFSAVDRLVAEQAGEHAYLRPLAGQPSSAMRPEQLRNLCTPSLISGGLAAPERSVATQPLADALSERVKAEPLVELRLGHRVLDVKREGHDGTATWVVRPAATGEERFKTVVNALWSGRPLIDRAAIGHADTRTHHRYRVSAFIEGADRVSHASVVVAAGPFGDIKAYGAGRYYVSWYPAGLLAEGAGLAPPEVAVLSGPRQVEVAAAICAGLGGVLPGVHEVFAAASRVRIEGGWVYAQASGVLDDRGATLHQRDLLGISHHEGYFSVDTGKYSVAPWLAEILAKRIANGALSPARQAVL